MSGLNGAGEIAVGSEGRQGGAGAGSGRKPAVERVRFQDPRDFALVERQALEKMQIDGSAFFFHGVSTGGERWLGVCWIVGGEFDEGDAVAAGGFERAGEGIKLRLGAGVVALQRVIRIAGERGIVPNGVVGVGEIEGEHVGSEFRTAAAGPRNSHFLTGRSGHGAEVLEGS